MSAADVAALEKYIDGKVGDIAAAVWGVLLGSDWNGKPTKAGDMLASAQRYAIEAGYPYNRPDGNPYPNTPTMAALTLAAVRAAVGQTDTLEASEAAQATALAGLDAEALATAVAGKLGGSSDAAVVKAAVVEALKENLPTTFVAQPPTAPTA